MKEFRYQFCRVKPINPMINEPKQDEDNQSRKETGDKKYEEIGYDLP
jgi:hypothetical protein